MRCLLKFKLFLLTSCAVLLLAACGGGGPQENLVRIPLGAGGFGFLPLQMMREYGLIEKHAQAAGLDELTVEWLELGGPAVMNDALLAGSVDFIAAGPPAFITLWDRTRGSVNIKGVAAIAALPMYLNTRAPHLNRLEDLTQNDRIAVTAIKVSIPAIVMQIYALETYGLEAFDQYDDYTVTMTHADGVVSMLSGSTEITSHFTSPPFYQRETADPDIRTIMSTDDVLGGPTTFTMLSTTQAYHDTNPEAYQAVLTALEEAQLMIRENPQAAVDVLMAAGQGGGLPAEELLSVLADPDITFTSTPQN
ncbi:ABC transporter substrate-binding protein, partial [Gammaproteobacteria bacterium AH-315-E17]|nr:ABC transporter substrate-binding protein [Gammaproteobacteria bacterium AH-315-E17]